MAVEAVVAAKAKRAAVAEAAVVVATLKEAWKVAKPEAAVMAKAEVAAVTKYYRLNLSRFSEISYFYEPEVQTSGLLIFEYEHNRKDF